MTTLVDDIVQALKNLGGQASLDQIYAEVYRIRKKPLPKSWQANIRDRIECFSSDSHIFKGKDYFRRVSKGVWALRDPIQGSQSSQVEQLEGYVRDLLKSVKKQERYIRRQSAKLLPSVEKPKKTSNDSKILSESYDEIANTFRTIQQYREFTDPVDLSNWYDYVNQFFHLLGFNTEQCNARLFFLTDLGVESIRRAFVGFVYPVENFEEIIPGLNWETILSYFAHFHQMEWGILTDGFQLKVLRFENTEPIRIAYWSDLDGIIRSNNLEAFFAVYKAFASIKQDEHIKQTSLDQKQKRTRKIKAEDSIKIPDGLSNVLDVCREVYTNGLDYTEAYVVVAQRKGLKSIHTVADACTRRIGLNTHEFRQLLIHKHQLVAHLTSIYPENAGEISKVIKVDY